MITIAAVCESDKSEARIGLSPDTVKKFASLGCKVQVQSGAGKGSHFSDDEYKEAGASIAKDAAAALKGADIVLAVRRPDAKRLKGTAPQALVIGLKISIAAEPAPASPPEPMAAPATSIVMSTPVSRR